MTGRHDRAAPHDARGKRLLTTGHRWSSRTCGVARRRTSSPRCCDAETHFEDCEDSAQEALLDAADQWPREGVPRNPRGWLIRVASRRLIDAHRANATRAHREIRQEVSRAVLWNERTGDHDDSLQMLVLCSHPCLSTTSAVALTLRAVGGLGTREIAAGLLVPEPTAASGSVVPRPPSAPEAARFGPGRTSRAAATLARSAARAAPDLHHRLDATHRRKGHRP